MNNAHLLALPLVLGLLLSACDAGDRSVPLPGQRLDSGATKQPGLDGPPPSKPWPPKADASVVRDQGTTKPPMLDGGGIPSPPQVPAGCKAYLDGMGSSCKDLATWTTYGTHVCSGYGLTLREVIAFKPCGKTSYAFVYHVCCK